MWQITTNNCVQISSTQKQTSEPRPRLKSVYRSILTKQLQLFYYSKHCIFIVNGQFRQTDPRPLRRPEYTSVSQTFSTGCRRVFQPVVSTWNWPPHMVGWSVGRLTGGLTPFTCMNDVHLHRISSVRMDDGRRLVLSIFSISFTYMTDQPAGWTNGRLDKFHVICNHLNVYK